MIETLFVVNTPNPKPKDATTPRPVLPPQSQEDRVLDPKKSQNISILLRALNVTIEEVCEALLEGIYYPIHYSTILVLDILISLVLFDCTLVINDMTCYLNNFFRLCHFLFHS